MKWLKKRSKYPKIMLFPIFNFILTVSSFELNCTDAQPWQMICRENSIDFNNFNNNNYCKLDSNETFQCTVFPSTMCDGPRTFELTFPCRYCFQLSEKDIICDPLTDCEHSIALSRPKTMDDDGTTNCKAYSYCIGPSIFRKKAKCMKGSKSQKYAFILSLTLGGFAADRFYLGYYAVAAFKALTFGGFGIIYMIDLVLITFGYLGPADGSLYNDRIA